MKKIVANKSNKKMVLLLLLLICIVSIILLILFLKNKSLKKESIPMELSFESRLKTLEEFDAGDFYKIGWLQVQGTNIDFPILDSRSPEANLKYSHGWRSPYYVSGQNREVLLGHNIINVSSTPMLSNPNLTNFEALMSFTYASFAQDNLYIKYTKDKIEEIYLIYAAGFYDYGYDDAESFGNDNDVKDYIKRVRKNSIYDYDIDVNENDDLLTVKTCTRYFGKTEKQEFYIDARKLRNDEEILKYTVETNYNFDELIGNQEKN